MEIIKHINTFCTKVQLTTEGQAQLEDLKLQLDHLFFRQSAWCFCAIQGTLDRGRQKKEIFYFNLEKHRQTKKKISKLNIDGVLLLTSQISSIMKDF